MKLDILILNSFASGCAFIMTKDSMWWVIPFVVCLLIAINTYKDLQKQLNQQPNNLKQEK